MDVKFVPFAVLNNGTDCNEGQYWNMDVKFVFATPTIVTRSTFDWWTLTPPNVKVPEGNDTATSSHAVATARGTDECRCCRSSDVRFPDCASTVTNA